MKEEIKDWFKGLKHEEGFGLSEVPHTKVRKKLIDTYSIKSDVNREDRKKIFCGNGVLMFLTCVIAS